MNNGTIWMVNIALKRGGRACVAARARNSERAEMYAMDAVRSQGDEPDGLISTYQLFPYGDHRTAMVVAE